MEVGKAVADSKGGKIDFKVDKIWYRSHRNWKSIFRRSKLTENAMDSFKCCVKN